ncbi:MAG: DUF554 domain-containing protein [Phototrophicaceae bacterium]|jgi:uncharacterized membrane protein YqgA involved in biofilm formation
MGGTLLNVVTVILGSLLGMWVGNRLPERTQQTIVTGLGLITFYIGISNVAATGNPVITALSIAFGALIGEGLRLDLRLEQFAAWLQRRVAGEGAADESRTRFITGFVTTSLLYCIGPLAFLGSILDGMGDPAGFQMLAVKSTLDGFASLAFAASFGVGVLFSAVTVFAVQGGLALVGMLAGNIMTEAMRNETTAAGGVILMGLSLALLDIKRPRIANFLPALIIAPLIVALAQWLGINLYPSF